MFADILVKQNASGGCCCHKLLVTVATFLIGIISVTVCYSPPEVKQYCQWETFNATCSPGSVILMTSARYGRMQKGKCLPSDYLVGCSADVLRHVDSRCSGRQACEIGIPDPDLFNVQPCRKDLVAYFEASYTCVQVSGDPETAPRCGSKIDVDGQEGYIATLTTRQLGLGSFQCPWSVTVQPGQRIRIYLYDFSTWPIHGFPGAEGGVSSDSSADNKCPIYAVFRDEHGVEHLRLCGERSREKLVYTSTGNHMYISIVNVSQHTGAGANFMLKYQATGCPDLEASENTHIRRLGDTMVVKCNNSEETWHLVCKGTDWIGEIQNCSKASSTHDQQSQNSRETFPFGLMLAIAVGVIIGVLLGFIFLLMAFLCRKGIRNRGPGRSTGALLYDHPPDMDPQAMYKLVEMRHHVHPHQYGADDVILPDDAEMTKVAENQKRANNLVVRTNSDHQPGRSPTLDILKGTPPVAACSTPPPAEEAAQFSADNWHPEDVYRTRSEIYPISNAKCFATVGRRQRSPHADHLNMSVPNMSVNMPSVSTNNEERYCRH